VRPVVQALWSLWSPPQFESPTPVRSGVALTGPTAGDGRSFGDVYLPADAGTDVPSVVVVHGGAFLFGHRAMKPVRFLIGRLLQHGLAVCSVDYRYLSRGGRLATSVADVTAALNGWVEAAAEFNCDTQRVGMVGISAGATIGLLAAASTEAPPLNRVVSFYGLYDLSCLTGPMARLLPWGLTQTADADEWHIRSPIVAGQPRCPTLLIHGTGDGIVPVEQAAAMSAERAARGLTTASRIYAGAPHSFLNAPCEERAPAADIAARFILDLSCQAA
jgi:acetyl esterase/lipase